MDKPISVLMEDFKSELIKVINESNLHISVVDLILGQVYSEVNQTAARVAENEKEYINDDTLYQLNYQNMIALNTHMTQKALIEIERLKAEIEQLKN